MIATSIISYINAICDCAGLWRTLEDIRPCKDECGRPIFIAGGSTIIFKVIHNGRLSKLKCFTRPKKNLDKIYKESFYPQELLVGVNMSQAKYIDVVLEEWVEGISLEEAIIKNSQSTDFHLLAQLFDKMAIELLCQPWAHGDLKPSNIIINNNKLTLIDFDSLYHPAFSSKTTDEWGTKYYQHPLRGNSHAKFIDDYPIALISTALQALALDSSLAKRYPIEDMLLISPYDAIENRDAALAEIEELFQIHNKPIQEQIALLLHFHSPSIPQLKRLLLQSMK